MNKDLNLRQCAMLGSGEQSNLQTSQQNFCWSYVVVGGRGLNTASSSSKSLTLAFKAFLSCKMSRSSGNENLGLWGSFSSYTTLPFRPEPWLNSSHSNVAFPSCFWSCCNSLCWSWTCKLNINLTSVLKHLQSVSWRIIHQKRQFPPNSKWNSGPSKNAIFR